MRLPVHPIVRSPQTAAMPLAKAAPRIDVNALLPWRALICNRNMPVTGEDAATSLEQKFEPGRSERKHRLFEKDHLTAGVPCPGLTGLLRVMTPCLRAESPSAANRRPKRASEGNWRRSPLGALQRVDSVQTSCGGSVKFVSPDPWGGARCGSARANANPVASDAPISRPLHLGACRNDRNEHAAL